MAGRVTGEKRLLLLFIGVLSYAIRLGLDIDCGCFGPEDPEHRAFAGLKLALFRDFLLFIPVLYLFWYRRQSNSWDSKETAGKSEEEYKALLGADLQKKIVIYCGFVKCTRSHNGALWAKKLGYARVYRYPGGIFAWKGAGLTTEEVK